MSLGAILLLSVGLALDATAASAARGVQVARLRVRHVLSVAGFFGGFQALMSLLGWLLGSSMGAWFRAWDHWIAFGLLEAIGAKMIWEGATAERPEAQAADADPFGWKVMLVLAVATSIDALAAGTTLPLLDAPFALSLATIGGTTALLSVAGLIAGRRFGALLGGRLDVAGGLMLVGLGLKILVEHLTTG